MSEGVVKRRFRFGLRTLFVVVMVVGIWIGWSIKLVHERRTFVASIEQRGGRLFFADDFSKHESKALPLLRQLLGDRAVLQIEPPRSGSPEEDEQIRVAFPEAYVYYRTDR